MTLQLKCARCGRFLAEIEGRERVRGYCRDCKLSTVYEPEQDGRKVELADWSGHTRVTD